METQYVRSRNAHIAFRIDGDGPVDLISTSFTNLSIATSYEEPRFARYCRGFERFARVIRFDWRGLGLSDPFDASYPPTLEEEVSDMLAVMDAASSPKPFILGTLLQGPVVLLFAATHPERVAGLILINTFARLTQADDYPIGVPDSIIRDFENRLVDPDEADPDIAIGLFAPSVRTDERFRAWWNNELRRAASPATALALNRTHTSADVRYMLSSIRVPTLILNRKNMTFGPEFGRYIADHIKEAKYLEVPGEDMLPFTQNAELFVEEIEEFCTGIRHGSDLDRHFASILFMDIVASTERVLSMGDKPWSDLLGRHHAMVARQVERFDGELRSVEGDGFLATFGAPGRAIRAALAIREEAAALSLEVRAGIHAGEVERRDQDIQGIAVHIGSRVCSAASPRQILVTSAIPALVAGSRHEFVEHGSHELKGVPGTWLLYEVVC